MKDYLIKKKYDLQDIDKVIDKLKCKGYLNDEYYAKCYITNQVNLSNDGPIKIIKHLEGECRSHESLFARYRP